LLAEGKSMSTPTDDEWSEFQRWKASNSGAAPDSGLSSESADPRSEASTQHVPQPAKSPPAAPSVSPAVTVAALTRPKSHKARNLVIAGIVVVALGAVGVGIYNSPAAADERRISAVESLIDELGGVTLASADTVAEVLTEYKQLTPAAQERVKNVSTLNAAAAKIEMLLGDIDAAQSAVDTAIEVGDCESAVAAETLVSALTSEQLARTTGEAEIVSAAADCAAADQAAADKAAKKALAAEEKRKNNLIRVSGGWWSVSYRDADKGCYYFVQPKFKNLSKKALKYVTFDVNFVNKVDDSIADIDGETNHRLQVTGPIGPGKSYSDDEYGFNLNYGCGEPEGLVVNSVKIDYKDGTSETIDQDYVRCTKSWNKSCAG